MLQPLVSAFNLSTIELRWCPLRRTLFRSKHAFCGSIIARILIGCQTNGSWTCIARGLPCVSVSLAGVYFHCVLWPCWAPRKLGASTLQTELQQVTWQV